MNLAARKELANLASANSANVRISRIIDKKVVPEDKAVWLKNAKHLRRNPLPHCRIENRCKNSGLQDDVERCVGKIQSRGIPAFQTHSVRTELSRLLNPLWQQVNPKDILRECSPLN
jgi:hypothetical protein